MATTLVFVLALAYASTASASLTLLQPTPDSAATFSGNGGYSADGLGQVGTGGVLRAEVPGGSTVEQAYLYGTYFGTTSPSASDRTIDLDGTSVVLQTLPSAAVSSLVAARADVTSQVAAKVGGGGGITTFTVNTDPADLNGVGLVVVYSNPDAPFSTIALFDGGAQQSGDSTSFNFAGPLDPSTPGFGAQMSIGSGHSFQGFDGGHTCGTGPQQSSTVDVNGTRLSSCAGNYDDGVGQNGALITVGGVGDSLDNPDNPNQLPGDGTTPRTTDDELYNLVPLIHAGDMSLTVNTKNASSDDDVFLLIMDVTASGCASANGTCTPPAATVRGTVYRDNNGNARRDAGEPGLGGVRVFVDLNNNGRFDATEPTAVSAADGTYGIANAPPGNRRVLAVSPIGFRCTQPAGCVYALVLHNHDNIAGQDFGESSGVAAAQCVDTRKFKFQLHHGPHSRVIEVQVYVNGKLRKTFHGRHIRSITIQKLPSAAVVRIVATHSSGSGLISRRTYTACTKGKPKTKARHHKRHSRH